jgi:hypothetical protein
VSISFRLRNHSYSPCMVLSTVPCEPKTQFLQSRLYIQIWLVALSFLGSAFFAFLFPSSLSFLQKCTDDAPYKHLIALIVKGHNLASLKLRIARKETPQQAPHPVTKSGPETEQIQFGDMRRRSTVVRNVLAGDNIGQFEIRCRTGNERSPFLPTLLATCSPILGGVTTGNR